MKLFELRTLTVLATVLVAGCEAHPTPADLRPDQFRHDAVAVRQDTLGRYAAMACLRMTYNLRRSGGPLVSLQGVFRRVTVRLTLAQDRQAIAVELHGNGPSASDAVRLARELKAAPTDPFGYSTGATVVLGVTTERPTLVGKFVIDRS